MTIIPMLDFGDVVYRTASNSLLKKLDVVYHSAIRFITKAPYNTHHCTLYSLVGWPSLHNRCLNHWYQLIYKSILGKTPSYLSTLITISVPVFNLRSSKYISLDPTKACTSFGRSSFKFSAANDWNTLQKSLKLESTVSITTFKVLLSNLLTDHCTCWCSLRTKSYVFFCTYSTEWLLLHLFAHYQFTHVGLYYYPAAIFLALPFYIFKLLYIIQYF